MSQAWHKLISREGVDLLTISGLDVVFYDCIRQHDRRIKEPFFTVLDNKILTHYLCVDELRVGRAVYKNYFHSPKQVEQYYAAARKFLRTVSQLVKKWQSASKSKQKSGWELAAWRDCREQFEHVNYHFSIWPWWGIESWQIDFENILRRLIARHSLQDREEQIRASIYKPWRKTAIIKLQDDYQRGAPLQELIRKYQFLRSWSLVWHRPIGAKWIKDMGRKKVKEPIFPMLTMTKVYSLLKPTAAEKRLLALAPYISFFKDWRDDIRRQHVYAWSFLFDHLAKKFHCERQDLGLVSLDEMDESLQYNHWPRETAAWRKNHPCVVTTLDGSLRMKVIDRKIFKYAKIASLVAGSEKSRLVITGTVAQRGKVTGPVRLLKTYHDIKKVRAGDILVANTTHPNYLPAMQLAAAFITNEGGTISHAAIVARELKKPCLVGTKIATQVLKDGDRVEVNADEGEVRKI